ncbi:HigA family addiction module antitoxin [Corynebacterium sp. 153RC1]|uniref:HigA family addiction module antitoxin n=1 Tax=unclassified Corynebacterium TaxID=2624378 RepID=UPI00211CB273|nr:MULTISPECIES: HigA family addiction module antitoxin [unclassified Corynebacterium]MCQ9370621.1 HigA family addiction module antitoxin [Corynebacterium sp. 35RC1]MCQ9351724.1 HigA family addiction module antitoxin [Corynebacterium sp. 209RC1]MCQ9354460.1 HigA family addiction module antitoxin [Corynebacterium sp. 1222RC1]MCQ9356006.1 HigA family addiction module antitoxin [Corynebacterium sp. 122RC1]MCQ9358638.1 HigA family addiction module antitoxin [Corynebacterium sp. 142RC1]
MNAPIAAELFPAGEILADELEARGWTQTDFAEVLGRPTQFVSEIISGKKEITRESAAQIGAALGTSAEFWLNLQNSYLLWKQSQDVRTQDNLNAVKTRARLRELAPISLLAKRGYITATDVEEQAREVLDLFGKESFADPMGISFAARRSNQEEKVTIFQEAWAACVRATAKTLDAAPYSRETLEGIAQTLSRKARDPQAFAEFQTLFAQAGVKLVYVEAFPGGKLDGCAMMVEGHPVIGISGRGRRLDKVLFTILHEVAHILLGHLADNGEVILDDLSADSADNEAEADRLASSLAISRPLPEVPSRVHSSWINEQANHLEVHPFTLIGRLQKEGKVPWKTTLVRNPPSVLAQLESWKAPLPVRL